MHWRGWSRFEQVDQQVELAVVVDRDVVLLDRLDRGLVLRQVHLDRLVHVPLGQLADVGADGRREQQGLVRVGDLLEDPLDVGAEPDVEHPVGLVEDDVEDVAQVERPPLDVVEDAARGADDDVDARAAGPGAAARSARRRRCRRWRRRWPWASFCELDDDLLDQFAGRRQDDGLGASAARFEHLDERDAERGGLAGAGLGLADDVEAVEGLGDEGGLDREWGSCSGPVSRALSIVGLRPIEWNPCGDSSTARRIKQTSRKLHVSTARAASGRSTREVPATQTRTKRS